MVDELRRVFDLAQQQPEKVQRDIAEMIAHALEDAEWDLIASTPESQRFLADLADEALAEIATGTTRDLDESLHSTR